MSQGLVTIAILHSPFKEKFGIPRQPGLVQGLECELELLPPYNDPAAVAGLEGFSHLWLTFLFHANRDQQWRPKVRPPRLGGNQSMGVFATRSPYRPNALGLSVVELLGIDTHNGVRLTLGGADLLDGTPIVDIKPYIPYVDAIPEARAGFAPEPPAPQLRVTFTPLAEAGLDGLGAEAREVIAQILALDPRPAYQREDESARRYAMRIYAREVQWRVVDGVAVVEAIEVVDG